MQSLFFLIIQLAFCLLEADRLILHSHHPPISLLLSENSCRYPRIAAGFVPVYLQRVIISPIPSD